jgi:hypothetical protein
MGDTGPTGSIDFAALGIMHLAPSPESVVVEAPRIATIDELTASLEAVVAKENQDKAILSVLIKAPRETLRGALFQWAAAGFPLSYIVKSFTIVPPPTCSDGVTRDIYQYINYCLGVDLGDLMVTLQSKAIGIAFNYSIVDFNVLNLHVGKA